MEIVSSGASINVMSSREKTVRIGHLGGKILRTNMSTLQL
jgi:hypothetical protein